MTAVSPKLRMGFRSLLLGAALSFGAGIGFAKEKELPLAPPPREVAPDGSREPVPAPGPKENPLEVVERIVNNSKVVGDKLARTDTGDQTRGTQKTILKDIDSLIEQQDNPPPPKGGESNDQKKNQKNDQQDNQGMGPPGDAPKGGDQQSKGGRKPRKGGNKGQPPPMKPGNKNPGGKKQGAGKSEAKTKANPKGAKGSKSPKNPGGGAPKGKLAARPSLPIDDSVVKEVWGHLPDKLRQQVSQYYKEQFMPKYSELLKRYYSSLANTARKP